MKISSANANSASSKISHMPGAYRRRRMRRPRTALVFSGLVLCACSSVSPPAPPSSPTSDSTGALSPNAEVAGLPNAAAAPAPVIRPGARWIPSSWAELPGWGTDRALEVWTALRRSCEHAQPGWERACVDADRRAPADDASARAWLMLNMAVYRVESLAGSPDGMITGYFEPFIDARRQPSTAYPVPLHMAPPDLTTRVPYWTRQQLDTLPAARASLRGHEIAYVADVMDALVLQIQGSGRLRITETDGRVQTVRLAFAAHNGQAYASVGRWLIERGEMRADNASWPTIREWARRNPKRINEMLWSNPRVVFFREEPLPDAEIGPRGAQGVPLTPGRSIAVDPRSIPYGTMVWLDTTEPLSSAPLQRLVMAQDTGTAITGAVRADYFWGWAGDAEAQSGRMKQPLRMWALWPKG